MKLITHQEQINLSIDGWLRHYQTKIKYKAVKAEDHMLYPKVTAIDRDKVKIDEVNKIINYYNNYYCLVCRKTCCDLLKLGIGDFDTPDYMCKECVQKCLNLFNTASNA